MIKNMRKCLTCFYWIIFLVFLKLFIDVFRQDFVGRSAGQIGIKLAIQVAVIISYAYIYYRLDKKRNTCMKHGDRIAGLFTCALFAFQMILGNQVKINPMYDLGSVYHGAIEWLVTGSFSSQYEYFYYYPNNIGPMLFLRYLFQIAAKLKLQDFYMVAMVVNGLLACSMVWLVYLCAKELLSTTDALMCMVLIGTYIPFYFVAPVFYTDELTLVFPILLFYLYLKQDKAQNMGVKVILGILFGAVAAVGYMLKPTVWIVAIAVFMYQFIQKRWKELAIMALCAVLCLLGVKMYVNHMIYPQHLNEEIAQEKNTPMETWLMMGLNQNLGFSSDDTDISRNILDPVERREKLREEIKHRISDFGFWGLMKHYKNKGVRAYSDGTFELAEPFMYGFQKSNVFEPYLTNLGAHYGLYWDFCSVLHYSNLFFMILGLGFMCFQKGKKDQTDYRFFVAALGYFGLYVFLLLWEVHPRYIVNFFSFLILLSVMGIKKTYDCDQGHK